MALLHINYRGASLEKATGMYVVLPDGAGPFPTVYMLHGLSDDYTAWQRWSSIERYAESRQLLIVMLDSDRAFYTNSPALGRYEDHVLESVRFIDRTFHTLACPERRGIGGLSMGGYGAAKLGLKFPETFGSLASHSGVLDMASGLQEARVPETRVIYGTTMPPDEDCFALAARPGAKPAIYFDCGVDDGLLEHNRRFAAHLTALGIAHTYAEYPGGHSWEYWDAHIPAALDFHCEQFARQQSRQG
jgi:S-formylglutathione hydrolase FrmB